jgi:hypothetical protein
MRWLAPVAIASIAALGVTKARADLITVDFSVPDITNLSSMSPAVSESTSVSQFNPALGNLTSVSINETANLTWVGAGSSTNQFSVVFTIDNTGGGGSPFCQNPCTFTINPPVDASNLPDFIGTGSLTATTMSSNASPSFLLDVTFTNTAVTYTYTPVSAVPAPLIGHGYPILLAVGGILFGAKLLERRRNRCSFGTAALR